jgi:hypothetical protein
MVEYVVDFIKAQRAARSRTQDDSATETDAITRPCICVDRVLLADENTGLIAKVGRICHYIADVPQVHSAIVQDLCTHLTSNVQLEDDDK